MRAQMTRKMTPLRRCVAAVAVSALAQPYGQPASWNNG
jgi:hypothetical protein